MVRDTWVRGVLGWCRKEFLLSVEVQDGRREWVGDGREGDGMEGGKGEQRRRKGAGQKEDKAWKKWKEIKKETRQKKSQKSQDSKETQRQTRQRNQKKKNTQVYAL